jgi:hypothetical protein
LAALPVHATFHIASILASNLDAPQHCGASRYLQLSLAGSSTAHCFTFFVNRGRMSVGRDGIQRRKWTRLGAPFYNVWFQFPVLENDYEVSGTE